MSYPKIFERVYCNPLCITAQRFQSIHAFLLPRLAGKVPLEVNVAAANASPGPPPTESPYSGKRRQKAGPTYNWDGRILDPNFYTMAKPGVAVVPVYGTLAKNLSSWEESCGGGTDINAPQKALAQAVAAADVDTIVLDVDSPGGEVTGIPEFAELVREAAQIKTVYAFTDASMCSAAYWLGSQAGEVYATRSATIGSIGTYLAWLDESVRMQLEGLRLELFAEGKHKGIGLPGRPLTQEDRVLLQSRVTTINQWFTGQVRKQRNAVTDDTMQGQVFGGVEAQSRGLVDGLVGSWDQFLHLI